MSDEQPWAAYDVEGSETETPPRLSDDGFYRALASTQRRRLLALLCDENGENEHTVEEMATVLAGWDAAATGTMATPADRKQIQIELLHIHLPLLAESGLVTHDPESATITLEPLEDALVELILLSVDAERSPSS